MKLVIQQTNCEPNRFDVHNDQPCEYVYVGTFASFADAELFVRAKERSCPKCSSDTVFFPPSHMVCVSCGLATEPHGIPKSPIQELADSHGQKMAASEVAPDVVIHGGES